MKIRVLFLSSRNACRSRMAEGLVNHYLGDRVAAFSAGADPCPLPPEALSVMSEIGIAISGQYAKSLDECAGECFDYVITLLGESGEKCTVHGAASYCGRCGEPCPHLEKRSHGGERLYFLGFPDPSQVVGDADIRTAAFRKTRDAIESWLIRFFADK